MASGGRDGYLRVWRIPAVTDVNASAHPPGGLSLGAIGAGGEHPNVVTCIALDPATRSVWTSCLDGYLRRWAIEDAGEEQRGEGEREGAEGPGALRLAGKWATGQPALCLALSDEDRVVYVGTANGTAFAFDAGEGSNGGSDDDGRGNGGTGGTSGELCHWVAHDGGATRSVAASAGGCVTGSSTGPILAWRWRRPPTAAAAAYQVKTEFESDGSIEATSRAWLRPPTRPLRPPALISKLLGHTQACVALSTGNPAHLVGPCPSAHNSQRGFHRHVPLRVLCLPV